MADAVVFIANGSEEVETFTPVDYLRRAKVCVKLVSVASEDENIVCSHKIAVKADETLKDYLSSLKELPDAVVVPGGIPGSPNIASSSEALDFINSMNREGKLVCAICAAPAVVLGKTEAPKGKKWTCYPGMKDQSKAEYVLNHVENVPFIHDKNLITACGAGAAEEFAMEIVKTLCGEDEYKRIHDGCCQR